MKFSIVIKAIHESGSISARREVVDSEMEEADCILRAMDGTTPSTLIATLAAMLLEIESNGEDGVDRFPANEPLFKAAADLLRPIKRYRLHYGLEDDLDENIK